jgi:sortase A
MPETRATHVTRLILLVVGIVCLGTYFESYIYRTVYQIYAGWQFDHEAPAAASPASAPAAATHGAKRAALPAVLPNPDRGAPRSPVYGTGWVVGRLSIPRLKISALVEEGVDETTLARAVGHIPGTALPGELGNIGIAGHRDTFFQQLKDLKPHDEIDFTTHSGSYHYTVESLTVVDPNDVSVLESTGSKILTIVTCFPFHYIGNAPRRFIVHAVAD